MSWRETFLLEKVVASKQLNLGDDAATKQLGLAMEMDKERKARLEKIVATAQPMLALLKVWSMWVRYCPSNPF